MPQIEVARPLTVTLNSGQQKHYQPGVYEVDQEVADHWFVKPHLKQDDKAPLPRHPHEGDTSPAFAAGLVPERPVAAEQTAGTLTIEPANEAALSRTRAR